MFYFIEGKLIKLKFIKNILFKIKIILYNIYSLTKLNFILQYIKIKIIKYYILKYIIYFY